MTLLLDLPSELLILVAQYCDPCSQRSIKNSCSKLFGLFSHFETWTFDSPMNPIFQKEIKVEKSFEISFTQEGEDLLKSTYDHQVRRAQRSSESHPDVSSMIRFMGFRIEGDRCCFSRLPLNAQLGLLSLQEAIRSPDVSMYFEVTVLEGLPSVMHYMRIGLVGTNASHQHPPGSGPYGIGYQR